MDIPIMQKSGRAANGLQRDHGTVTHAVPMGKEYGHQKSFMWNHTRNAQCRVVKCLATTA